MQKLKIGIIKEYKTPPDKRVPLTPEQCSEVMKQYQGVEIVVQKSKDRCFSDLDYFEKGIALEEDLQDCDIIIGVKEIPKELLLEGKTYIFFSHIIKKQEHNKSLLQEIVRRKITLIDWERMVDDSGQRIVAFGKWAGIVGCYNAFWMYGKRYNLFHIRRVYECSDLEDMKIEFEKIKLPFTRILLTGGGRVAKGCIEMLNKIGVRRVSPYSFLHEQYHEGVYTQLNTRDYMIHKNKKPFVHSEFYNKPELYVSQIYPYLTQADILISAHYWDPRSPKLFTMPDVLKNDFSVKIIADITCDINGSVPTTVKATTIFNPAYDIEPTEVTILPPFSSEGNITVMSIDNLPCEIPRDASTDFGTMLIQNIFPCLLSPHPSEMIQRATIVEKGNITEKFSYLENWIR